MTESDERNYEFDDAQNEIILALGKSLNFVGATAYVAACIFLIGAVGAAFRMQWSDLIGCGMYLIFFFATGNLMMKSGRAFEEITATSGTDIKYLMEALDNLRQVFAILSVIIILVALMTIVSLVILFMNLSGGNVA